MRQPNQNRYEHIVRHLWRWASLSLLFFVGVGSACVQSVQMPKFPNRIQLTKVRGAKGVQVVFYGQDQGAIPYVLNSVQHALKRTSVWGQLSAPLTIRVFPTHRSLEQAVLRNYSWLRAWALYQDIYLQSPRTWRVRHYKSALSELLVHELTHVAMYQLCCSVSNWRFRDIPFWFREGMASVTARQGRHRWSMERLSLFGRTEKGRKVMTHPEHYLQRYQSAGYSLAHWMFLEIVKKWKNKGVRQMLSEMRRGLSFTNAFRKVTHITPPAFRLQFLKQLRQSYTSRTTRETKGDISSQEGPKPSWPLASKSGYCYMK